MSCRDAASPTDMPCTVHISTCHVLPDNIYRPRSFVTRTYSLTPTYSLRRAEPPPRAACLVARQTWLRLPMRPDEQLRALCGAVACDPHRVHRRELRCLTIVTWIIVVTKHAPMLIIKSIHTVTSDCHHVIAGRRGVLTEDLTSQLRLEYVADGFANVEDVAVRRTRHAVLLLCRTFKLRGAFERCHVAEGVLVRTPGHILDGDIATTTGAPCEPSRACPARAAALRALQRLATPAARGG